LNRDVQSEIDNSPLPQPSPPSQSFSMQLKSTLVSLASSLAIWKTKKPDEDKSFNSHSTTVAMPESKRNNLELDNSSDNRQVQVTQTSSYSDSLGTLNDVFKTGSLKQVSKSFVLSMI